MQSRAAAHHPLRYAPARNDIGSRGAAYHSGMDKLTKFLPIAVGVLLGYLLTHPPVWLAASPVLRFLLGGALVAALLIGFVALVMLANFPKDLRVEPIPMSAVPADLNAFAGQYEALGFQRVGTGFTVGVSPPATMVAFVNEPERTYATAFATGTLPRKISFDCFSVLDGDRAALTSAPERMFGTIPAGADQLRQAFPGATVAQLFGHHRQAIAWLRTRGLPCRAASARTFEADFRAGLGRGRRNFAHAPISSAMRALVNTITKSNKHLGSLERQPIAQRQVAALIAGRRSF